MASTLDQWVTKQNPQTKKPNILNDEHALYLYEQSFQRQLDKLYEMQFERKIAEDKAIEENHKKYIGNNYVRVGGN